VNAQNITISEAVFRDLISQKSKIEDIKMLLAVSDRRTKHRMLESLENIVYSRRYNEGGSNDGENT